MKFRHSAFGPVCRRMTMTLTQNFIFFRIHPFNREKKIGNRKCSITTFGFLFRDTFRQIEQIAVLNVTPLPINSIRYSSVRKLHENT